MNKEINFPIKYAVLELKENGGYLTGYKDITRGFIASKCYVVESAIVYNSDGSSKIVHKVVFPFNNIEKFKLSLRNGRQNIGNAEVPKYDACNHIYPISIVDELFDSYDFAKFAAEERNEDYRCNILSKTPSSIINSDTKLNWQEQYEYLRKEFEEELEICNLFEKLILLETKDMDINEELSTDKTKSFIKVLKQK